MAKIVKSKAAAFAMGNVLVVCAYRASTVVAFCLWTVLSHDVAEAQGREGLAEYLMAEKQLEERQWVKAGNLYRMVVETGPEFLRPHATLGLFRVATGLGEDAAALNLLESLVKDAELRPCDREFWLAVTALERAKIPPGDKGFKGSIRQLEEALKAIEDKPPHVRLRAEIRLAMAELLSRAGRGRRAIRVLTGSLPELRSREWAGLRAYQKARLARIYMEIGERDWAVSLLEEIRHDPHMDSRHFQVAEAFIDGRCPSESCVVGLVVRDDPDCLSVESPGCFELRITARKGEGKQRIGEKGQVITQWFNLREDPFRTVNLLAGGSLLEVIDSSVTSSSAAPVPVIIEVLESSSARVRFRSRSLSLPLPRFEEYTVYPDGRVFVLFGTEELLPDHSGMELLLTTPLIHASDGWQVIDPERNLLLKSGATFEGPHLLLSRLGLAGRHWAVPDDLLLLPANAGGRLITNVPPDARFSTHRKVSCKGCGKGGKMAVQLRIMPSFLEEPDLAEKYRGSYQHPANLVINAGELVLDDSGDLNFDGYNEGEGCHVVRGTREVELRAGVYDRKDPVIKFVLPGFVGLPDVRIDGKIANSSSYNLSWAARDTLILRWNGTIPAGGRLRFALK